MTRTLPCCPAALLGMFLFVALASAATEAETAKDKSAAPPAAAAPAAQEGSELDRIVPEVTFEDQRLDDIIEFLTDLEPRFKALVIRDPDVPRDYPQVRLRLKRVPLGQILEVLTTAFPDIEVSPVQANNGPQGAEARPVYIIKVHASDRAKAASGEVVPGGVKVYRLTNVVGTLAQSAHPDLSAKERPTAEKEAMDQVLSLVKAALSQVGQGGGNPPPVLQVHPETQTLIFKGSSEQRDAVEDVLAALAPEGQLGNAQQAELRKQAAEERRKLQAQLTSVQEQAAVQVADLQKKLQEAEVRLKETQTLEMRRLAEAERAKIRLEEQQKLLADLNAKLSDLENRYDAVRRQQGQPQQPSGRDGGGGGSGAK
jgi:hypothetical protein